MDVFKLDLGSRSLGPYTEEMAVEDCPGLEWALFGDRTSMVNDEERGRVLQVQYPAGTILPQNNGAQFVVALPPSEELWLSYDVKFSPGFDFRRGGKLPGLSSHGAIYSGGHKPVAGDGWSARLMWREGGAAVGYIYHLDMPGKYGEDMPLHARFQPGVWHTVTEHVTVNEEGQANGTLEIWLDGQVGVRRHDMRWRLGAAGLIDSFFFSTFHGGNTPDYHPQCDGEALFDRMRVWDKT